MCKIPLLRGIQCSGTSQNKNILQAWLVPEEADSTSDKIDAYNYITMTDN